MAFLNKWNIPTENPISKNTLVANSNSVLPQNDRPIVIQPAPVIIDGRTVAEVVFETINNMQYKQTSIAATIRGVTL